MARPKVSIIGAGAVGTATAHWLAQKRIADIVLTNPLDAMTYLAYKVSGLPRERILGQSGALDTTRFRTFLATELGVSVGGGAATVIGAHTDKDMVPLASLANVRGIPVRTLLPPERVEEIGRAS